MFKGSRRRGSFLLLLLVLAVGVVVLAACGGSGGTTTSSTATPEEVSEASGGEGETAETAEEGAVAMAPAFTADELNEEAGANWITNGGNLTNDRFSSLSEINTENVSQLKGDWMTKIGEDSTA